MTLHFAASFHPFKCGQCLKLPLVILQFSRGCHHTPFHGSISTFANHLQRHSQSENRIPRGFPNLAKVIRRKDIPRIYTMFTPDQSLLVVIVFLCSFPSSLGSILLVFFSSCQFRALLRFKLRMWFPGLPK